jgi:hypothetical protein
LVINRETHIAQTRKTSFALLLVEVSKEPAMRLAENIRHPFNPTAPSICQGRNRVVVSGHRLAAKINT